MDVDPRLMLLGILAVPAAAGLICAIVLFLRMPARNPSSNAVHAVRNIEALGVLSIADAYDGERSALWENQVITLQRIASEMTISELAALWEYNLRIYPELYEGTTTSDLLTFLQSCNLAESKDNIVRLTANGRDFLKNLQHQHTSK